MNIRKKIFLVTLISVLVLSNTFCAYAQWGQKRCPKDKCYGNCGASDCDIYRVVKITTYISYEECKKIVNRASKVSTVAEYTSYVIGIKYVPAGILTGMYASNISAQKAFFQQAVTLKRGIKISYEWVITNITSCSYARKGSYVFK